MGGRETIGPQLPVRPASEPGPKPLLDRPALQSILFVRYTGIEWEDLPQELGFGSRDDLLAALTGLGHSRSV